LFAAAAAAQVQAPPATEDKPAAPDRPLWEAGMAAVAVHGPDYPAAGTSHWRGAVAPIIVYRGKRFRVDDDGVRGRLLDAGRFEFDVSGAASFNSRSSAARQGMPQLDYTFELGPQALYRMPLGEGQQLSGHFKMRRVFSTNWRHLNGRGYVIEPELRWRRRGWPDGFSQVQLALQADWASEALQDYFYQVDPAYATAARPAYDARAGYFGSALRASFSRRLAPSLVLSVGATLSEHTGAANRSSPLFERSHTLTALAAVVWTPWHGGSADAD
jgi:outer membrane scaffolding protein for murein synthesis (MipA/OmpV family)